MKDGRGKKLEPIKPGTRLNGQKAFAKYSLSHGKGLCVSWARRDKKKKWKKKRHQQQARAGGPRNSRFNSRSQRDSEGKVIGQGVV